MGASTYPESSRGHIAEIDTVYDEPYLFGRRPNTRAPWPFTERQFAPADHAQSRRGGVRRGPAAQGSLSR
jgi:hypothetical protein